MQGGRDLSEELDPLYLIRLLSEMSVIDAKLGSTHEPFLDSHRLCPLLRLALCTEGSRRRIEVRYHTSLPIVGSHNQQRRGAKPANISLPSKRRLRNAQRRHFSG